MPAAQPACRTPGSDLLGPGELCTFPLWDGQSGRQLFQSLIEAVITKNILFLFWIVKNCTGSTRVRCVYVCVSTGMFDWACICAFMCMCMCSQVSVCLVHFSVVHVCVCMWCVHLCIHTCMSGRTHMCSCVHLCHTLFLLPGFSSCILIKIPWRGFRKHPAAWILNTLPRI